MVERVDSLSHSIQIDDHGGVWVDGTVRVTDIILEHLACHLSPESIHDVHPALSLGQIYSALAYYHDHEPEFEHLIRHECEEVEREWAEGR